MEANVNPKIKRVKISKFRSIKDVDILLNDNTALVGKNSSGKSNILKAINSFFNYHEEVDSFNNGSNYYKARNSPPVVEIEVSGLSGISKEWVVGDTATLKAKFTQSPEWLFRDQNGDWVKTKNRSGFHELDEYLSFVFIPIKRDHSVAHERNGLLTRALGEWRSSSQRDTWSPKLEKIQKDFQEKVINKFQNNLQNQVLFPNEGKKFVLDYPEFLKQNDLFDGLEILVDESGKRLPLSESGSGTENLAILSLYSYIAEIKNKNYILAFEEPEQNLHPQAQFQLVNQISNADVQTIFTTHSSAIVDSLRHQEVVLCRKKSLKTVDNKRPFFTEISQVSEDFYVKHGIDESKYSKFHNQKKSDFIFSNFVIVTESINDSLVIEHYLNESGIECKKHGIEFVSLDGVNSINYMYSILSDLEIPFLIVLDKDFIFDYSRVDSLQTEVDINGREFQVSKKIRETDKFGLPVYSYAEVKNGFIKNLFDSEIDSETLAELSRSRSAISDLFKEKNIIVMNYSFELDFIKNPTLAKHYASSNSMNIEGISDCEIVREVITKHHRRIKDSKVLIDLIDCVDERSRPQTLKTLKKIIRRELGVS